MTNFTGISYLTNLTAFYKMTGYADEESAVAVAHFDFSQLLTPSPMAFPFGS